MAKTPLKSAEEVLEKLQTEEACVLLDVRTPIEYRQIRAKHARHLPLQNLTEEEARRFASEVCEGRELYILCKSGARSAKAAEVFERAGVPVAGIVDGGTDAWVKASLPVISDTKVISLERQVRLAIGLPIVLFSLLALLVHPLFVVIPLLFGCGLTVAGATDWCGMALFLSRMPWNRAEGGPRATCSVRSPQDNR